MKLIESFEPVITKECKVLILGTMPGPESLRKSQYYGSPKNYFWDIMFRIFKRDWGKFNYIDDKVSYDEKKNILLENKVGLWDVIDSCEREGSSDKNIINEKLNDFNTFFKRYSSIDKVIFNGKGNSKKSAYGYYIKEYMELTKRKQVWRLNSTSSQNPNNPFYILNEWNDALSN